MDTKPNPAAKPAIARYFRQPELSLERLSVLKEILEGVATECANVMRDYSPYPASFLVNKIDIEGLWDVLERYEGGVALVYYASRWDARVIVGVDRRFIFSIVDAMFGCEGGEPPYESDRPCSALELKIVEVISRHAMGYLTEAFGSMAPTDFVLERVEPSIEFMMMGQSDYSVIVAQLILQILDRGGQFFILVPQSALQPFREKLERGGAGKPPPSLDAKWSARLAAEITASEVELKASINAGVSTMKDVMEFEPGTIVELPGDSQCEVVLSLNDTQLAKCELAQSKGRYALRVCDFINLAAKN